MHKIVLKKRGVSPVAAGHPWVFADSIDEFPPHAKVGDEVKLVAPDGNFLAWGLYSPHSMIRARLYSFDRDAPFSRELLSARIASAIALRERVVRHDTDSCRLVFGEGDSLPGLLVDRYGDSIAVTFTTAPMAMRAEMVLEILEELLAPACVIALPDPSAEKKEKFRHPTGVLAGELPERLIATENGIRYVVDVESAQRKMLYFDQRENRAAVADNARGRMLDLYCYSGGFSLNCALSESTQEALAVDSSEGALKMLEANIAENEIEKGIFMLREDVSKACRQLEAKGEVFDTVVLDPPAPGERAA
ncbi:MAG: class I SAM-dependent methyltransferase [Planctomycetota bacterium]|nr:class I SAM-dependent methyltransferase [Planctomycetota bacterium]